MIEKVVVSAAGQGTRMLELTKDKSKHLINVASRPFLAYLLDNIITAEYRNIILVVGFREDMIRDFLRHYQPSDIRCRIGIVNQYAILGPKEKEYGTACPLKCVKDLVRGGPFISLCGDNFYSVTDLKGMNVDDGFTYVAGLEHPNPEKYGVLVHKGGFLQKIIEKPKEFLGNMINPSLYKFTPEVFEKLPFIKKSPRGEYEITDVISLLAQERKVKVKKLKGFWMDLGRPEDVETFAKFLEYGNLKTIAKSA